MRLKLQYNRLLKGYTRDDIAKKIGVIVSTYRNYETGVYRPHTTRALMIAQILDCTLEDVLYDYPCTDKYVRLKKDMNQAERLYKKQLKSQQEFADFLRKIQI